MPVAEHSTAGSSGEMVHHVVWCASAALLTGALAIFTSGCEPSDPVAEQRQLQSEGRFEETLEPLRELLDERRDDPELQYLYGQALTLTGQAGLAEWSLRAAMEHPDWLVPAGMQLALGAMRSKNYDNAIQSTTQILAEEPDHVDVLLLRANAYAQSRRFPEKALADAERILELDPDKAEALEPQILALIALERIDEAGEAIEQLGERIDETQLGPETRGWHCATAALFAYESDELELAEERFADCTERFPGHANVVSNAVDFYDAQGNYARSLEILTRALEEKENFRQYRLVVAQRLRTAQRADEAEALLRDVTESDDPARVATGWMDLAKHHQELGDHIAALAAMSRAVELARELGAVNAQLLLEYADALMLAGRFDEALEVADEMEVAAHRAMIRARVAQLQGKPEEALEHFDEGFRLWPDNPWARYYAALAAEALGDFDRAIAAYRYSIRIDPGATDARVRLARLHLSEGKAAEALFILRTQQERVPLDFEGELLALALLARQGRHAVVGQSLERIRATAPQFLGRAVASAAKGQQEREGAAAALGSLRGWQEAGFDFATPAHVEALRVLVELAADAGELASVEAEVQRAIEENSESASPWEIRGISLERGGSPPDETRAAYERSLELDPDNVRALIGIGRLTTSSDPASALEYFDRALAADPYSSDAQLAAARVLIAMNRPEEAAERLGKVLTLDPYNADAAERLARLKVEQGSGDPTAVELANRAVRFGGGAPALDLLSRIYEMQNEPQLAMEAAERARRLRATRTMDTPSPTS